MPDYRPVRRDTSALRRQRSADRSDDKGRRWWVGDEETLHERVQPVVDRLWRQSSRRRQRNLMNALTYNDNLDAHRFYDASGMGPTDDRLYIKYNILKNAAQTAGSIVAKNRPRPVFLTSEGSYTEKRMGQALTRYVCGVIDDQKFYKKGKKSFRDACVYGTGAVKWIADSLECRVRCEWTFLNELLVDDVEGMRERPAQLHQRMLVDRDELCTRFPDKAKEIDAAATTPAAAAKGDSVADVVVVAESWHLPSGPDADDGCHALTIPGATLFSEPWEEDWYPIVFFRWEESTLGFWGQGMADEIGPIQHEITDTLTDIAESRRLFAVPFLLEPVSCNLSEDEWRSNNIARRIKVYGQERPEFITPGAMAPDVYAHLDRMIERAYQILGVPMSGAAGEKQPGLDSGEAIREAADITGGRMQLVGQAWEEFHAESARVIVGLSKRLYEGDKDLEVQVKGKRGGVERIRWADVDLDRDRYILTVSEISALPSTPQGRIQTLMDWLQQGIITREEFVERMGIPDVDDARSRLLATIDCVLGTIDAIKSGDGYDVDTMAPIPEMDLNTAHGIVTQEIVLAYKEQVGLEKLELLRSYNRAIEDLLQAQQPPAPPPGPPGQGQGPPQGPPPGEQGAPPPQMH